MRLLGVLHGTAGQRPGFGQQLGRALCFFPVLALFAPGVWAQTPEGVVITNMATVTWTDAYANTYSSSSSSVSVTVAFQAGIDVIAGAAVITTSPSTADTLMFQVANIGNGTDSVTVSESISVGGIITVTGYRTGATTYATLADLNVALSGTPMAQGATITIQVIYDVAPGQSGQSTAYFMAATSRRDVAMSDADLITISLLATLAVQVTPDGGQTLQQLASHRANYTFSFTVANNSTQPEDFDLLASHPGVAIAVVSVNGVAGDSTRIGPLASGATQGIDVVYAVADVAAGTADTLVLRARSVTDGAVSDTGFADLTVIRPSLTLTAQAYRDDQTTLLDSADVVIPGEFIRYRITVINNGETVADSVQTADTLRSQLSYDSYNDPNGDWSISENAGTVTSDLTGSLAAGGGMAFFWIRVALVDGTPAGMQVSTPVVSTYQASNGRTYSVSDTVVIVVGQVAAVAVDSAQSIVTDPGNAVVFNHTIANAGNGIDSITVVATSRLGWPVSVFLDLPGDNDPEITGPIEVAAGDTARFYATVAISGWATLRGTIDTVDVQITSLFNSSVYDVVQNIVQIRDVGILVTLNTSVDQTSATIGDILTYTITYSAAGPNTATNFEITDPIPAGSAYVPGSMQLNGTPLTDVTGDDAGFFDVANDQVLIRIGNVTGGDTGTITFQVLVGG